MGRIYRHFSGDVKQGPDLHDPRAFPRHPPMELDGKGLRRGGRICGRRGLFLVIFGGKIYFDPCEKISDICLR